MKHLKYLLFVLPFLFLSACSDDDDVVQPPAINEAELAVMNLEGTDGGYLNKDCPSIVSAQQVYEDINGAKKFYIIDVRAAADFAKGRVPTAKNVAIPDILTHMKTVNVSAYDRIVIVCYSGQSAAFSVAILRMAGYSNVSSMKYGMSSWHSDFDKVTPNLNSQYVSQFVKTETPKGAAGNLPTINTGKTTGKDIVQAQVEKVLADGWSKASITAVDVFLDPSRYYIVNYWPKDQYDNVGHIPGSIQYTPKNDLKLSTFLKTLPTNKTIVVYCYTGQTSANVATILRVMGYDAKSLSFGTNGMIWQMAKEAGLTAFSTTDIMNFSYEK